MRRKAALGSLLGLFFLVLAGGCSRSRPSLILVTVDGLRADAVAQVQTLQNAASAEGKGILLTPVPDTVPALCSLMAGESAQALGTEFGDLSRLPASRPTLAETLRERGYATAAFIGDGEVSPLTGLARGFDLFSCPSSPAGTAITREESRRAKPWRGGYVRGEDLVREVTTYLRSRPAGRPLFLWIHLADLTVQTDLADPAGFYKNALPETDKVLGVLRDAAHSSGLAGKTVFAVLSPHGLALGEEGETRYGLTLAGAVIRVPLVIAEKGPARIPSPLPLGLEGMRSFFLKMLALEEGPAGKKPVLVTTRLPERLYGWPPMGLAAGEAGELSLLPEPNFRPPQGPPLAGEEAWNKAPAELRRLLEEAGLKPSPPGAGAAARVRTMGEMGRVMGRLAAGERGAAREILEEILDQEPQALEPRLILLRLLAGERENTAAQARSKELAAELGQFRPVHPAQNFDLARFWLTAGQPETALGLIPDLPGRVGYDLAAAELLAQAKALEAALARLNRLLEAEKEAPELQEWSADLLMSSGNAYRARLAFEAALASPRGRTPNLLAKLGDCLAQLNESDLALRRFAEAAKEDPSYLYPHARAADILLAKGERNAGLHAVTLSVARTDDPVQDAIHLAQALEARELLPEAASTLYEAGQKNAGQPRLKVALARVLTRGGKPERARPLLDEVLEANPEFPPAWVEVARLEAASGRADAAIAALGRAEVRAGPELTQQVRQDPLFQKAGPDSALARRARAFQGQGGGDKRER